jgi:hypothetical protein
MMSTCGTSCSTVLMMISASVIFRHMARMSEKSLREKLVWKHMPFSLAWCWLRVSSLGGAGSFYHTNEQLPHSNLVCSAPRDAAGAQEG